MAHIIKTDDQWGKKPHAEGVEHSFDPYEEELAGVSEQADMMNRAKLIKTAQGPQWGFPIYQKKLDPVTGRARDVRSYFFFSQECPVIEKYVDPQTNKPTTKGKGIPIPRHRHPRPCLATSGCTSFEADPVHPEKVYLFPEGFYMSHTYFMFYQSKRLVLAENLRGICFGCVKEHIDSLIERDPTLFVDLSKK